MNLDIIEIGLSSMTDGFAFEKSASEMMREEGYHDIKPLGGVGDHGQDAFQDNFYYREGRVWTVFQYTLENYIAGKLRDTVTKLGEHKVEFSELVIVTPSRLSAERQRHLKKLAREDFDFTLNIYERKTLVNRLSDFSNGIFHRHFPDIEKQIETMKASRPVFEDSAGELETAMLKVSIAFVFEKGTDAIRKSIFDRLVLACLICTDAPDLTLLDISHNLAQGLKCEPFQDQQIGAALHRLEAQGLVTTTKGRYCLTDTARSTVEGATIEANNVTASMVSDIVEEVCSESQRRISYEERNKLERNTKEVLKEIFRLMWMELANQFLEKDIPSPLYLESSERILALAKRQTSEFVGELLVAALANAIQNPSAEQSQVLAGWARTYLGAAVMNLDPIMREFQTTRLRGKIFILDTDFVLRSIVREHPRNGAYLALIQKLSDLGSRLIIPEAVVDESLIHTRLASRNYKYFGNTLLSLTEVFVHRKVNNLLVQGYYYGRRGGAFPLKWSFDDYLQNYYDPDDPLGFLKEVIAEAFPSTVEILDPTTLLSDELSDTLVEKISKELLKLLEQSWKSEHMTSEQKQQLAHTDARLFVTSLQLSSGEARPRTGCILGGSCYILTNSSRYLRGAKALNIRDVVSTRPQQLLALMELVTGPMVDDVSFARLFENPLLNYAVEQVWADVRVLLSNGIALTGKSLPRLRRDLDKRLHSRLSALELADEQAESEDAAIDAGDREYIELFREATSLGYSLHPALEPLQKALAQARDEAEFEKAAREQLQEQFDRLAAEIERFGKRKQRYLRRIARQ